MLLLAAGGRRNDARIRELLGGPLDWEKLGWLAERERAAPVLWERLRAVEGGEGGPGGLEGPSGVAGERLPAEAGHLRRLAMVSEFRMMYLEQRLRESLAALSRSGVEAMLLKGAALAVTVYGSFVRRPMVDLDILVRPGWAERARDVLLEAGWVTSPLEEMEEFFEGHHHLPALNDARGTGVQLEIHTALFFRGHPFRLSTEELWRRAVRVSVAGWPAYVPGTHDQLLHLCLHFAWSHMMATGGWRAFRDVEAVVAGAGGGEDGDGGRIGTGPLRWPEFVRLARESRGASCCYWTLRLARRLAGVAVPEEVLEALRPPLPEVVLDRVERHFIYHLLPTEALCPSVSMAYTMWQLGVRPGWSGHGAVRPWDRTDDLLVDRTRRSGPQRLADQLRNLRGWARYVRSVLLV